MNAETQRSAGADWPQPMAAGMPRSLADIEDQAPHRALHGTLYAVAGLFAVMLAWASVGRLDIIASAPGRLVPQSFVKIVQPAEAGVVLEILVREGDRVAVGQVLLRMDPKVAAADGATVQADIDSRRLQLRRIDAELADAPLVHAAGDPVEQFAQVEAQYRAHRQQLRDALAQEEQAWARARHEEQAARAALAKLQQSVPVLRQQAESYARLGNGGFFPTLQVRDKEREANERARDLDAQESTVQALRAAVLQAERRIDQLKSTYRSNLRNERIEADNQLQKLLQEDIKQTHRAALLELRAPQAGIVKDLATHTAGAVVSPGTVLLTVVPENEPLLAEVEIRNDDVGFVAVGQKVRLKLVAYPFQKYGMLEGEVRQLAADAQDPQARPANELRPGVPTTGQGYRARIALQSQTLAGPAESLPLVAGMQVIAEIHQGERTVLEYLLSPIRHVMQESGRER